MMVPEAAAAGALYVSAENAMFNNIFGGAQIIEVIIMDSNRSDTDERQGEPVVKVDENQLRMIQGIDGNWYGYFGDKTNVPLADGSSYLEYGTDSDPTITDGDWAEANNVYKQGTAAAGTTMTVITNYPTLSNYNNTDSTNPDTKFSIGQIGIAEADWPVIQLYDFSIGMFDVVYEQAGADEVVTLDYNSADLDDYASLVLDRNSASQGSESPFSNY